MFGDEVEEAEHLGQDDGPETGKVLLTDATEEDTKGQKDLCPGVTAAG
jgi:hypothetical protein